MLALILEGFIVPGPTISLVYPSSGHQSAKVRVFSDFAADLMHRWSDVVKDWLKPGADPVGAPRSIR